MKILVAEDDLVTREIIKRILANMSDEILEANNGVEALELIEREDPEFLFTDIQMPLLDGMAVVEAVRSSRSHSKLPIVCTSSVKDKEDITRLVALGVADYILKPLRAAEVHERFRRVIAQHAGWRQRQGADTQTSLLLVDADPGFRQFALPLLEEEFAVSQAISGAHALRVYQESDVKPTTILVAEGLPLVSETQVVNLVSKLAIESRTGIPTFWLVSDGEAVPAGIARHFAGVIRRSFVPESFMSELRRTLLAGATPTGRLRRHLHVDARPWLVAAVHEALGAMSGEKVTTLESMGQRIDDGVCGRLVLSGVVHRVEVVVACNRDDAVRLAGTVARRQATPDDGGRDLVGRLSETIGGRVRAALLERSFDLQLSRPDLSEGYCLDERSAAWDASVWCTSVSGGALFVGIRAAESLGGACAGGDGGYGP